MELIDRKYYYVKFNRNTGKIYKAAEGYTMAQVEGLALYNNMPKTQDFIIFDEFGNVHLYGTGTGQFPHLEREDLGNISDYCPGLLDLLEAATQS